MLGTLPDLDILVWQLPHSAQGRHPAEEFGMSVRCSDG